MNVCFIWRYNHIYPVTKIENALLSDEKAAFGGYIPDLVNGDLSVSQISNLRIGLPQAFITIYTFNPLVGKTSQTDANGVTTYYEYDSLGRLIDLKDDDENILKTYEYNYAH